MAKKPTSRKPDGKPAAKRRAGRPKRTEPAVTPAKLEEIASLLLEAESCARIAARLGIDESTVRHYRDNVLRPRWEVEGQSQRAFQLAKIDRLEAFAWDRLHASTQPTRRRQIKRALEGALEDGKAGKGRKGKAGADLAIVERVMAYVTRTGEACWAQIIEWCADYRARVFGYYAPTRHQLDVNELRVAGPDPSAVDKAMFERLAQKIRERQTFQRAIQPGTN